MSASSKSASTQTRVSIAKAARLLGIDRHELCERLCKAGIESFEGQVELEAVENISPKLKMDTGLMNERVRLIRQTARRRPGVSPKRRTELELQDELDRMHNQWLAERKRSQEYHALFDVLIDELGHWQNSQDPNKAKFALEFSHWLCGKFD